uniref:Reverse transcriptase domain-containing protein n=1 Tax=Lates calcarifer TaxID=8187 RepID=A0A4W6D5N5_LATCA
MGDFNIHLNKASDPLNIAFLALIDTFGFTQSVHEPTHCGGNTLDLILSRGIEVSNLTISPVTSVISDHFLIKFDATLVCPPKIVSNISSTRHIGPATLTVLSEQLPEVLAPFTTAIGSVDNCTRNLNKTLSSLLDSVAPLTTKIKQPKRSTPWFTDDTRALKQACRKLQRKWCKSKSEALYLQWHQGVLEYKRALSTARAAYFSNLINSNKHNPRFLSDTVAKLTKKQPPPSCSPFTACEFQNFFCSKIDEIRLKISSVSPASAAEPAEHHTESQRVSALMNFDIICLDSLSKIVLASKPTTCLFDPLPGKLSKDLWPVLGPAVLNIVDLSLTTGTVPSSFKTAVVKPLLKKPHLDPGSLGNYRPVSNLPFFSKILEKVVYQQLSAHLADNNLFEPYQSAFRAFHSTETALAKVVNDLLLSLDSGSTSLLILLDLSAAFDTVDHRILMDRLENRFGISGVALSWLKSYLSDRTQCVSCNNTVSAFSDVKYGVPQGSVLGPLLFSLYIYPLGQIIRSHGINFHCYADDTQLYVPIKADNASQIRELEICLSSVTLSFDQHIKDITKTAFFHLRNIARIRSFLSMADAEILVHAFVSSRLDYCNVLLSGLPRTSTKSLQMVQNAAARMLTRSRRFDHITPVLASLHWLPVHVRSDFKVLLMTYKILNGLAPSYLSDLLNPYIPSRALRSQSAGLLSVPRVKKKSAGCRAFSYRAPFLWNNLPSDIRQAESVEAFKSKLKTHLYALTFN